MTKHYWYPDGYSLAEKVTGVPKPTRDELRMWALRDIIDTKVTPIRGKRRAG